MAIKDTDTIVQELVKEINCYPYRTEGTAFLLNCTFSELMVLTCSESNAPQLCPLLGRPVWLGQNQEV